MTRVDVLYFAVLRDAAGVARESIGTQARDLRALYAELHGRHAFPLEAHQLRVAMGGVFADWDDAPVEGSEVAFIPPVSGG